MARSVNSGVVMLYWSIGDRLRREVLRERRAAYGQQVVATVAAHLVTEYGRSYNSRNLFSMIRFATLFRDREIVNALSSQLTWTHFRELLSIDDELRRQFYAEMCRVERWSVRTLQHKIDSMLYERTALSRKPAAVITKELAALRDEDRMSVDLVFRDPVHLNFLGLADTYAEKDLEAAMLREIERVLREFGSDFCFVARQYAFRLDSRHYKIDLVFFHRRLRRLIAVDLKVGRFAIGYKAQMELYLRWLERHEMRPGEDCPLGLILCTDRTGEHVEMLELEHSGIRVAEYLTDLPPREVLRARLHDAIALAREHHQAPSASLRGTTRTARRLLPQRSRR